MEIPTDTHLHDASDMIAVLLPAADGETAQRNIVWLAEKLADRDRRGLGGNNPPVPIDPENLLRIPPDQIPGLLATSYPELHGRGMDLLENAIQWQEDRGRVPVADQQEAHDLVDQQDQIAKFAHPATGEVEATRRRVKEPIYEAGKKIDGHFTDLRARLLTIAGLDPKAPPGPTSMQARLTVWQRAKVAREQAERAEIARKAKEAADAAIAAARVTEDDDALIAATVAEETAAQAQQAAAAPPREMARSITQNNVGVGLRANWTFRVVDIQTTILAAAMPIVMERLAGIQEVTTAGLLRIIRETLTPPGGPVPLDYLVTNDSLIRAGIKGDRGRRECPGLEIFNDAQASRRSG